MFSSSFSGFPEGTPDAGDAGFSEALAALGVGQAEVKGAPETPRLPEPPRNPKLPPFGFDLSAPAGPGPAVGVTATHRGGTSDSPMAQLTLEKVRQQLPAPRGFSELLVGLAAEDGSLLDDLCLVPEQDLIGAFDVIEVSDAPLTSMQRAALVRYLRMLFSMAGYAPPGLGSAVPERRPPPGDTTPADRQTDSTAHQLPPRGASQHG